MSSLSDWYNAPKSDRGANQTVSKPSSSSGSSSSSSSRSKVGVGMPAIPSTTGSSGMINPPMASGGTAAPYQVDGVTYTPGPTNWDSMSQSQRDAYGNSLAGRNVSTPKPSSGRGPGGVIGPGGGWMDGQYYPPMPQQNTQNYKVTAGMGMGGTPPPMPATGGTTPFPVKTPEAIAAEAKARTDALLAKQTTIAGQTKTGFQTAYDRLASTTKDDRTLADAAFQRNTNPFSGSTGFQKDMTGRQREISDQQSKQDLQTRLANVDLSLADYTNANEAERMKMETDMTNAERAYGLQVDQLALQRRGQELGQSNADRSFGLQQDQFQHGVSQDNIANNHWQNTFDQGVNQWDKTFNQNQTNSDRTFNAGRQDVAYNQGQDKIKNDRNAANDALTLRKQHIDEANYYSDKYGIPVDPKDDFQLVLDQVAGLPTVSQKTAAQKAQDTQRAEAWKIVEFLGSVPEVYSELLGVPAGTQSQKAKESAMDAAYKNRTLDISQQNANTSSRNADTSRMNADRQANPNQPKQQSLTSYTSALNQRYLDRDNQIADRDGLERAILSLPVDESTLTALYNYYGIPMR